MPSTRHALSKKLPDGLPHCRAKHAGRATGTYTNNSQQPTRRCRLTKLTMYVGQSVVGTVRRGGRWLKRGLTERTTVERSGRTPNRESLMPAVETECRKIRRNTDDINGPP